MSYAGNLLRTHLSNFHQAPDGTFCRYSEEIPNTLIAIQRDDCVFINTEDERIYMYIKFFVDSPTFQLYIEIDGFPQDEFYSKYYEKSKFNKYSEIIFDNDQWNRLTSGTFLHAHKSLFEGACTSYARLLLGALDLECYEFSASMADFGFINF